MPDSPCISCGYPLESSYVGQIQACPSCTAINQTTDTVNIPKPLLIAIIAFSFGIFLGPSVIATTKGGQDYLEKKARGQ